MKIAIASSGLGHVARGIETWALDLAEGLAEPDRYPDVEITLFAAAPVSGAVKGPSAFPIEIVPCLKRGSNAARLLTRFMPGFAWRWGLKSVYGWEQFTFWLRLWPRLRRGRFDILHVQDPMLAFWCRRFRALKLVRTREILAHGTEETPEFLAQFDYVQHLAPGHGEESGR